MSEWIEWNEWRPDMDRDCLEGAIVDVELRDGYRLSSINADELRWDHDGSGGDIMYYRLHEFCPNATEQTSVKETNPKQSIGLSKVPMHLWSPLATAYGAVGLANGKEKYGLGNYKATEVILSIYISATMRHLLAFLEGQECDPAEGVPHIAAILANMAIILDARACGTLIDDRPIQGGYLKELEKLTEIYQKVVKLHEDKNPRHYTIKDNPEGAIV